MSNYRIKIIDNFLNKIRAEDGLSNNTLLSYRRDLQILQNFLLTKNIQIEKSSKQDLQDYFRSDDTQKYSNASLQRKISCYKNFYQFLENEGLITINPAIEIKAPRSGRKIPKFLPESDVKKILDSLLADQSEFGIKLSCMLEIMYSAGLRVSELVNLPIGAIKYRDNEIDDFLIIKGKGNKERIAPLNETSKYILKKYLVMRKNVGLDYSRWLFVGNFRAKKTNKIHRHNPASINFIDKPLSRQRFNKMLKELAIKVNIDPSRIHPHVFRHSFATHLLNRGADLRVLQELLGHSDISTTEIYTSVMHSKLSEAVLKNHPLAKIKT